MRTFLLGMVLGAAVSAGTVEMKGQVLSSQVPTYISAADVAAALQNFGAGFDIFSDQTVGGDKSFTGAESLSRSTTFSGAASVPSTTTAELAGCNLNSILYIGGSCAANWGNGDIGAQANAAYAALTASGALFVLPSLNGACYSYSTPIVFATPSKYALLAGLNLANANSSVGTCLNYVPTTATNAITLDYTPLTGGGYAPTNGLRDLTLVNNSCFTNGGCGSSATGVFMGNTNGGAHMATFSNVKITGFGIGINLADTNGIGWGDQFVNFNLAWNTLGMNIPTLHENTHWFGGACAVNGTCLSLTNNSDFDVHGVSFDANTTAGVSITAGNFSCFGCHFENLNSTTTNYITSSGGIVALYGGFVLDDTNSGTQAQMFSLTNASGHISGVSVFSLGRTTTNLFTTSNSALSGDFYTASPALIPSACSTQANCSVDISTNAGTLAKTSLPLSGLTVAGLGAANAAPGSVRYVTDSTAIASEGQTCVGGGSNKALAFSNGSVWKCF